LSTAGAKADVPGSPMPPGFSLLLTTVGHGHLLLTWPNCRRPFHYEPT
jgi:hypothetical protein